MILEDGRLGTVTLYNSKQEVAWQIEGGVCADDDDDCVPGMHVNLDGTVAVGGKHVSWVSIYCMKLKHCRLGLLPSRPN
jgi:hypothetical protein